MNIFEQASRLKLRFSLTGNISVENLWDVKLDSLIRHEEDLIDVVESYGKSLRRSKAGRKTNAQVEDELRLAVVSSILDTRIKEQEEATEAASVKANNAKIADIIARKQEASLENLSVEELQKLMK